MEDTNLRSHKVPLFGIYTRIKTSLGNYILFSLQDVKVYQDVIFSGTTIMEGQRLNLIYVLSAEFTYVDKTRKNETINLWHVQLGYISNHKFKVIMNNSTLKGLL